MHQGTEHPVEEEHDQEDSNVLLNFVFILNSKWQLDKKTEMKKFPKVEATKLRGVYREKKSGKSVVFCQPPLGPPPTPPVWFFFGEKN